MEAKTVVKILNDLVAIKIEDLNIKQLLTILEAVKQEQDFSDSNDADCLWKMSVQFLHIQQSFVSNYAVQRETPNDQGTPEGDLINLPEQLIFLQAVDRIRQFTLNLYLPQELRGLTKCDLKMIIQLESAERIRRLEYCVEAFRKLFESKIVAIQTQLENCILEYIAGVFSYYFLLGDFSEMRESMAFKGIGMFSVDQIFKSLLIIKGIPKLPAELSKQTHLELLRLTGEPGGLPVLCRTLLANVPTDEAPTWKKSEIIAKIVASKGHTKKFYRQVLRDVFVLYETSLFSNEQEENLPYATTCVECMRQLYLLPPAYQELRDTIDNYFVGWVDQMTEPEEMLNGSIVLERSELVKALYINYMAFSGSSCSSVSSSILTASLHIFLQLYSMIPTGAEERKYLQTLIVFCLSNRGKNELERILQELFLGNKNSNSMKKIHSRICVKEAPEGGTYSLQVGPPSEDDEHMVAPTLVDILKESNRNLLIYDVFVLLLKLLEQTSSEINRNVLFDAEEQDAFKCNTFYQKYLLIQALMDLVSHKHLHNQMYENPTEILAFIKSFVIKSIDGVQVNHNLLEIILSLFQELLQRLQTNDDVQEIMKLLIRFKNSTYCNDQLSAQIDFICNGSKLKHDSEQSPYQNAFSLCSDKEPYCKVYGTTLMIGLLKKRDQESLIQKHAVLILALNNLRNVESYAFLNSVRLLVALCDVLEADTIEGLIKEYQCTDNDVDYRLKVGEATIKTVEAIGPIAFKYREQLINCFLHECKSPIDELRASSLANLGNVCKILSYQVHTFFYEMFLVVKSTVETDCYLPARRAAILVLSQLIEGMDNLLDYQEYLSSIYRFLKYITESEKDDVTRLQAAVGLDHLKVKTKDFLNVANTAMAVGKLEKEIRIFGIKEQEAAERRRNTRGSETILTKMLD
ncbi:transport and Golgi organization protein 6 [Armigeres subalbatus]|uniref:transport and Golgi organization protein 6 n=1 Tax=Armigeres subalbatus TaxID=124917 RepID=UPI002ED604E6